tara:strand:+ start:82 stop:534 length:453 start_codon:yes stop_codon:yes gene_type:complete
MADEMTKKERVKARKIKKQKKLIEKQRKEEEYKRTLTKKELEQYLDLRKRQRANKAKRKAAKKLEAERVAEWERKHEEQYINSLTKREFKEYVAQEEIAEQTGESLNPFEFWIWTPVSNDFWQKMIEKHTINDDFWAEVDKIKRSYEEEY